MPDDAQRTESVGTWAKKYYFASRAVMDAMLRPYDLGSTQWYVLYQLAHEGPTGQRELVRQLEIERATLSGIVSTLVRKGFVEQLPHPTDQRQRVLSISPAGQKLWDALPDPIALIHEVAFSDVDAAQTEAALAVLREATARLEAHSRRSA